MTSGFDSRIHCARRITSKGFGTLFFMPSVRTRTPLASIAPARSKIPVRETTSFSNRAPSIPDAIRQSLVSAPAGPRVVMMCMTLITFIDSGSPTLLRLESQAPGARFLRSGDAIDQGGSRTFPRKHAPWLRRHNCFLREATLPHTSTAWPLDFSRGISSRRRALAHLPAAREGLPFHFRRDPARHLRPCSRLAGRRPCPPSPRAGFLHSPRPEQTSPSRRALPEHHFAGRESEPGRPRRNFWPALPDEPAILLLQPEPNERED